MIYEDAKVAIAKSPPSTTEISHSCDNWEVFRAPKTITEKCTNLLNVHYTNCTDTESKMQANSLDIKKFNIWLTRD